MVKAKKGKHAGKEDDLDDDIDVASVESGNSKKRKDSEGSVGKKDKKNSKGRKKGDDESDDENVGKKKNRSKSIEDSNDEEIIDKKSKKGKKKGDDSDEEEDKKGSKKKSKKDRKKFDDEDDDEVAALAKKVEAVDISKGKKKKGKNKNDESEGDESDNESTKKKGKSKNDKPKGFALLQVEDDGSDNDNGPAFGRPESPEESYGKAKPADKGGKKGKKSKKKRDDDDDEDIDKVLAELEMEYSGIKPKEEDKKDDGGGNEEKPEKKPKKKEKGARKVKERLEDELYDDIDVDIDEDDEEEVRTVKSAAQKKKEKKVRQKKEKRDASADSKPDEKPETESKPVKEEKKEDEEGKKGKKEKKGKKGDEKDKEKEEKKAKGPGKKTLAAMQEALRKIREEEERLKQEEEERIRREEEAEIARQEQLRIEKEKKEKKKQKEKERKERLKAEGKLLTAKQKADKARAQEMIAALRAQGVVLPDPGEKKPRPGTRIRTNKSKTLVSQDSGDGKESNQSETPAEKVTPPPEQVQVEIVDTKEETKDETDDIKDTWDAESSDEEDASEKIEDVRVAPKPVKTEPVSVPKPEPVVEKVEVKEESEEESESEEEEDEDESEESSEEESESEDEHKTDAEKKREKALARIEKRKEEAEKNRTLDNLRAAVVCVLGHVDTGKTKILDKLRKTHVQDGEAGGITQQIGATNVPIDNIKEACKLIKSFSEMELKIPGLLIIDTPGHESFSNLRSRGSSLCDIAILVVDIMHGLEPQTIESINLLKTKKTPFLVALNKIDRLYNWQTGGRKDIRDILKAQAENTQLEFKQRTKEVTVQFAEQGLNAALFFENPDLRSYVSLVPTSAITGEGMGNLLALIVEFCQTMLAKRLMYSDLLLATVLEVKAISGLGTTIDCILINGKLAEGDTIILAGTDGPIVTQIRSLLMPQPMKELRVKNAYIEYKEIKAAQGVKIAAKDLEKAIAGLNLQVAQKPDEIPIYCEEVAKELKSALSSIKLKERGVYVQASTLGSLEALLEFLRSSKIPVSGIRIGPVVKKDVMKASIMLEHEPQYATILAFDVKIERDAQELADSLGVKIFQADIIYHLFDKFMAYREELKQKKRDEFKNIAVFPCKLRILPQFVFNSRDPIVVGVMVEAGIVKEGTPLCVPSKEFLNVGIVTSVEVNHKPMESARKGQEVCIKIENPPGETPKLYGRHFDHTDLLMSRISRQSIDACKDYFRDDLTKQDWQLMVELKKLFQIL